ncbi:hypothetical protein MesoLj131b_66910 [Mesorhizobium sp. 131-2-5]|nr:hypothetical protein MesoLj131b_66910 [Mesorhizobium sp. 131-2-5]
MHVAAKPIKTEIAKWPDQNFPNSYRRLRSRIALEAAEARHKSMVKLLISPTCDHYRRTISIFRNLAEHRVILAKWRDGTLRDYHIRATKILWEYSLDNRAGAPTDSTETLHHKAICQVNNIGRRSSH